MPKQIKQEAAPVNDDVRIGIELEGVGSVTTTWKNKKVIDAKNFHAVFKRTPLVRSNSFSASRGVYIVPEDSETFGTNSPAELVSSPHAFNVESLKYLRESVKKALKSNIQVPNPVHKDKMKTVLNPMRSREHKATLKDPRLADDHPFQSNVATTRWAANPHAKIAGSLQTTIGVSVGKLVANNGDTRDGVVKLLIGDVKKQSYTNDLLWAAIHIQTYLTSVAGPLRPYDNRATGIRFAVFMYLVRYFAGLLAGKGAWAKTALGANFKGYSSFVACGVEANNDILSQSLLVGPKNAGTVKTEMIQAMRDADVESWITDNLDDFEVEQIGQPGHSLQTSVEKWFSIANFTYNNRLYTVVEAREKTAMLNIKMCEFLNGENQGDAQVFYNHVKTFTLAN